MSLAWRARTLDVRLTFDPMVNADGRRTVTVRHRRGVVGNLYRLGNGNIGRLWGPGWRADELLLMNWPELRGRRGKLAEMKNTVQRAALGELGYRPRWVYRDGKVEAMG